MVLPLPLPWPSCLPLPLPWPPWLPLPLHWRHRALFNACGNHCDPNSTLCTGYCTDRRNPSIVAFFQDKYFADEFIRLISTISHLVAPLLHLDTLTIVNSVLFVVTSSQLHLMSIFFALRTFVPVAWYCPVLFAKSKGIGSVHWLSQPW